MSYAVTLPAFSGPLDLLLRPRLTVAQVVAAVRERLARRTWISFEDLFGAVVTHEDVIVTFWAILELLKRQAMVIEQAELFGTISIGCGAVLAAVEIGEDEPA
jgi:segregation and condensation protein A